MASVTRRRSLVMSRLLAWHTISFKFFPRCYSSRCPVSPASCFRLKIDQWLFFLFSSHQLIGVKRGGLSGVKMFARGGLSPGALKGGKVFAVHAPSETKRLLIESRAACETVWERLVFKFCWRMLSSDPPAVERVILLSLRIYIVFTYHYFWDESQECADAADEIGTRFQCYPPWGH